MKDSQAIKRNISSMQVLKTLQLLLEDNYTMADLIKKLNMNEPEPIFNNSVISKYINTCRYCGIEIPKIHNKYFVANLPFGMDLEVKDLDLLEKLQLAAENKLPKKSSQVFDNFITRLNKYSNKSIIRVEKNTEDLTHEIFDKAIREKRRVKLMFRAKSTLECIPVSMSEKNGKTFFDIYYKGKEKSIDTVRVSGIEVLDKRFTELENPEQVVIFRLMGDLANNYSLREHEKMVNDSRPQSITISNRGENRKVLLARLLRYDKSCEIEYPLNARAEMREMLNKMLNNYEE